MGSACCKTNDVHPVKLGKSLSQAALVPSLNNQLKQKDFTELTVYDSINTLSTTIRWQRGDLIGQGVYGKVYQAMNLETGELLAVKTYTINLNIHLAEKELISIKRELLILRSLNHQNIIKYFQVDCSKGSTSIDILMEYVPSGSMYSLLQKYKKFSEPVIRTYTKQLLDGLDYLHSNEIIHRDLKSANILITEDSTLKLTDFGCSRRFDSTVSSQSKSFKGSPYWMSPEMVANSGHSYPSDIWSLGCLVIEMANGKPPWSNYSHYSKEVLKLIARPGNIPDIPKVSDELSDFIMSCLQRDPKKRLSTKQLLAHEFITPPAPAKCYDSIRGTSSNGVSIRTSFNQRPEEERKLL